MSEDKKEEVVTKPGDDTAKAQPSITREGASTGNTGAGTAGSPGPGETGGSK